MHQCNVSVYMRCVAFSNLGGFPSHDFEMRQAVVNACNNLLQSVVLCKLVHHHSTEILLLLPFALNLNSWCNTGTSTTSH